MGRPPSGNRQHPLFFALDLLLVLAGCGIVLVVLTGGFDAGWGRLRFDAAGLPFFAVSLLVLLAARSLLGPGVKRSGGDRGGWVGALLGPAGAVGERGRAAAVLFGLVAGYALFVGAAAVARHRHFGSQAFDLGLFDQAVWNTLHGAFLSTSLLEGGSILGAQFSPVLALLAQGYRFWPAPEFLLLVQTLFLTLGAWPVYLIAHRHTESRRWALVLAALFLACLPVRTLALSDFHPLALAVTPLLFAFHLLDERPRWTGYLFLLFALTCGEEAWLIAAFFGLYLALYRRRTREGLFLFFLSLYGFVFFVAFLFPKLGGGDAAAARFGHLGGGGKEIVFSLFTRPREVASLFEDQARLQYLRDLFVPLAFVPLLGPLQLAVALPLLAANLLSGPAHHYSIDSPGVAVLVPFVFAAAAVGLGRLVREGRRRRFALPAGPWLGWVLLAATLMTFGESPAVHFRAHYPPGYGEEFERAAGMIPPGAALSTPGNLVPHLSQRPEVSVFPAAEGAEYVLVDMLSGVAAETLRPLTARGDYDVVHRDRFFILLEKN